MEGWKRKGRKDGRGDSQTKKENHIHFEVMNCLLGGENESNSHRVYKYSDVHIIYIG